MRVFLTGAAGFVGAHVHRALIAAGHDVVAIDALSDAVHGSNAQPPEGVSVVDIRDFDRLAGLLRGVDVVCHLAAAVPPGTTGVRDIAGEPALSASIAGKPHTTPDAVDVDGRDSFATEGARDGSGVATGIRDGSATEVGTADGDARPRAGGDVGPRVDGDLSARVGSEVNARVDGDLSARVGGDVGSRAGGDMSARVGGEVNARVDGDLSARADGDVDPRADGDLSTRADDDMDPRAGGDTGRRAGGDAGRLADGVLVDAGMRSGAKPSGAGDTAAPAAAPSPTGGQARADGQAGADRQTGADGHTEPTWRPLTAPRRPPGPDTRPSTGPTLQTAPMFAAHNDFGTAVLLAAMERTGIRRLVLGSSVAVYGEGRYRALHGGPFFPGLRRRADLDRGMFDHRAPRTGEILTWEPVGEDAPLRPRTAYAASKLAQEHYALAWGVTTGGTVTALRYHHVYGDSVGQGAAPEAQPGDAPAAQPRDFSTASPEAVSAGHSGVPARFRAELAAGRAPVVFEDGGQVRDFVHVRDVAAATVAAVERPLSGFVPLNIASGHPITLWEVASIMSRARGGPDPVVSGQYRTTDIRHLVAHPERARHALEFAARVVPARGLADYATAAGAERSDPGPRLGA